MSRLSASPRLGLVIFDCDGVLIDSEPLSVRAFAKALNNGGIPLTVQDVIDRFTGHPDEVAAEMLKADYPQIDIGAIVAEMHVLHEKAFREELALIPGIEALVGDIDMDMAVASNSAVARLRASLGLFDMAKRFGPHIYSAEMVALPKPAPDLVQLCLERTGVKAQRAVMIDDNPQGIRSALAAGVTPIGFIGPSEHRPGHDRTLMEAGAWRVAHGTDELRAHLMDLAAEPAAAR